MLHEGFFMVTSTILLVACYIGVKLIDNKVNHVSTVIIKLQTSNHQIGKLLCLL